MLGQFGESPGVWEANLPGGMIRQLPANDDWTLELPMPEDAPFPVFDVAEHSDKWANAIMLQRERLLCRQVYAATANLTPLEIIAGFKQAFPQAGATARFFRHVAQAVPRRADGDWDA